jgi:tetratricopeptide (TPR) repeat protein
MAKSKRINRRALLLVALFGLFVLGGVVVIYIKQMPEDPAVHISRAEQYFKETPPQWNKARREYSRAIEAVKGDRMLDAKNFLRIAELNMDQIKNDTSLSPLERRELYGQAFTALERSIQQDSTLLPARKMMAEQRWMISLGQMQNTKAWEEFILHADRLLQLEEDAQTYRRRGIARSFLARVDAKTYLGDALADLRKAIDLAPDDIDNWKALLSVIENQAKDTELLEETFGKAMQKKPDSAELRIAWAEYLIKNERDEEALQAIETARKLAPDKALAYLALARYYTDKKQYDKAMATLQEAQKVDPTEVRVYFYLSRLHQIQGDPRAAADALRSGLTALDQWTGENTGNARINVEKARESLHYYLAEMLLSEALRIKDHEKRQALVDEAQKSFAILVQYFPDDPRQYGIAGQIAYLNQDWNKARENLETAFGSPRGRTARTAALLAEVYTRLRMPTRAEEMYQRIVQIPGQERQVPFLLQIARLRIDSRDYRTARQLAERIQSIQPDNEDAADILRALDLLSGRAPLPTAGPVTPLQRMMILRMAQEQALQNNPDQAIGTLETLYRIEPENLQTLSELIQILRIHDRTDRAVELVKQAQQKDPDNPVFDRWLTMLQAQTPEQQYQAQKEMILKEKDPLARQLGLWRLNRQYNRTDEAEAHLAEARKIDPDHPAIVQIDFAMAVEKSQWDKAREQIQRIADNQDNTRLMMEARLAVAQNQWAQAIQPLESILLTSPHLQQVRLMLAEAYLRNDQMGQAKEQLQTVLDNDRKNVAALLALARIAESEQNMPAHDNYIRQAMLYPAGKVNPEIRERWLQSQVEKKDPAAALAERQKIYQRDPNNLLNAMRLAALYENNKQYNQAIAIYEQALPKVGDKVSIAMPLARAYRDSGQSSKADALFSNLLKENTAPADKARILVAWGNFLASNDADAAVNMYNKAQQADPGGTAGLRALANLRTGQAQQLAQAGSRQEARQRYDQSIEAIGKAIAIQPEDVQLKLVLASLYGETEQFDKAGAIYRTILESNPDQGVALVGLGRIALDQNDLPTAMEYFNKAIEKNSGYGDGYIFRAEVHKARGQIDRAIYDLEKAVALQQGNLRLRMDLARLYEAVQFFDKAAQQYLQVVMMQPSFYPAHLRRLELFLRQQRWAAVESLAAEAMEQFPRDPQFPLILARMWKQRGQMDRQLGMLDQARQLAPDSVDVVRAWLIGLIEAGQLQQAMKESQAYLNRKNHRAGVLALQARIANQANPQDPRVKQAYYEAIKEARPGTDDTFFVMENMNISWGAEKILGQIADISKVRPEDWQVFVFLADLMSRTKPAQVAQILDLYRKAQAAAPNEGVWEVVTLRIANTYERSNDLTKAEATYKELLAKNPDNIAALNNLAYLYADKLGQADKALPLIERALQQRSDSANLLDTYAWVLVQLGQLDRAKTFMQQVISQGQPGPDALYHMGYLLEKTEDPAGAEEYYRQAYEMIRATPDHPLQKPLQQAMARITKE